MTKKIRLDQALLEKGFYPSREKAKAAVMAGMVFIEGRKIDKPGYQVLLEQTIEVKGNPIPFVSRGGLKLQRAVEVFSLDLKDKVVIDIGASTGGFTDCALKNGAKLVYAIDVGYGQLDWSLRNNPQVVVLERTNFRYIQPELIDVEPNFVSIDVSFISLEKIFPKVMEITQQAEGVALIKPQFEAGKDKVGKKGVVHSTDIHMEVISKVILYAQNNNINILGLAFSPIKGPEGNIEYLIYFNLGERKISSSQVDDQYIKFLVSTAHQELSGG